MAEQMSVRHILLYLPVSIFYVSHSPCCILVDDINFVLQKFLCKSFSMRSPQLLCLKNFTWMCLVNWIIQCQYLFLQLNTKFLMTVANWPGAHADSIFFWVFLLLLFKCGELPERWGSKCFVLCPSVDSSVAAVEEGWAHYIAVEKEGFSESWVSLLLRQTTWRRTSCSSQSWMVLSFC